MGIPLKEQLAIPEGSLDELVHQCKSEEATAINNDGVQAQIKYLMESGCTEQEIHAAVEENLPES